VIIKNDEYVLGTVELFFPSGTSVVLLIISVTAFDPNYILRQPNLLTPNIK